MKKMKLLTVFLALIIAIAVLPIMAFAADKDFSEYLQDDGYYHFGSDDASDFVTYISWSQYAEGQTFVLDGNIVITGTPVISFPVALDLNGYTISLSDETLVNSLFNLESGASLTIIGNGGSLVNSKTGGMLGCIYMRNGATLNIENANIDFSGSSSLNYAAITALNGPCTINISGGSLRGSSRALYDGSGAQITLSNVDVSSGSITAGTSSATTGTLTISNGTEIAGNLSLNYDTEISGDETAVNGNITVGQTGSLSITGGNIDGTITNNGQTTVTGGTFTSSPAEYVPDDSAVAGFTPAGQIDTLYIVGATDIAEKAGAAQAGDSVNIIAGDAALTIPADGVTVTNSSSGNVTVNEQALSSGDSVTTHTHVYTGPVWAWADDGSSATATFTCEDGDDEIPVAAAIGHTVKTPATCTAKGVTTYTATVTFNGTPYEDTKDVTDIAMIAHNFVDGVCTVCKTPDPSATPEEPTTSTDPDDTTTKPEDTSKPEDTTEPDASDEPDTGDNANMILWIALIAVSCAGIIAVVIFGKKKKK